MYLISIHVPSWGTTFFVELLVLFCFISIHVPSWGTTAVKKNTSQDETDFVHVPRGERRKSEHKRNENGNFNPRSSWGTTLRTSGSGLFNLNDYHSQDFNPRSLVGNDGKFSQIFFVFLCNKYNFSTFYYPFSLFFSVIHVTFLIFVVRILPAFYVYF